MRQDALRMQVYSQEKEDIMNHGVLVGLGFLAGTAGIKLLKSKPVRTACVKSIAQGMKAKDYCESIVDEAKAEFDDIMAEAEYEKDQKTDEPEEADVVEVEEEKPAAPAKKTASTRRSKSAKADKAE